VVSLQRTAYNKFVLVNYLQCKCVYMYPVGCETNGVYNNYGT